MTTNPSAHLYGPRGRIAGVAGILVGADVVAFSPWPVSLGYRSPFLVRLVAADRSTDEWRTAVEVVYLRLTGAPERTNVAGVQLSEASSFPVERGRLVPDAAVIDALADAGRGSRGALVGLSPERFAGLARRSRRAPDVAKPTPTADRPPPAVAGSFSVSTGPAQAAQRSLCRIFRWD